MSEPDPRIVYGGMCTWWESIAAAGRIHADEGKSTYSLPCCPHCKCVLFEVDTEQDWWASVQAYHAKYPSEDYLGFVTWLRGRCYPTFDAAKAAYRERDKSLPT